MNYIIPIFNSSQGPAGANNASGAAVFPPDLAHLCGILNRALKETEMAKTNSTTTPAPVSRSSAGLRDAIFDEIDAIRDGTGNPTRANAVAKLAAGIVETVRMELEVQRFAASAAAKANVAADISSMPKPLSLGG